MKFTKHAAQRVQQRGIPPLVIDLLINYGRAEHVGAGTIRYHFDKTSLKRMKKYAGPLAGYLTEHLNCFVIVSGEGELVTAAHRFKRSHH
ncbi:hypothetical protein [Noviherbaspirillum galbum]|uniref:DUF4258 domain-containing protein n=1 Tax=Noviherbaspirillum galbum TaxID=2709383 RepID=A0A6B3SH24_9BURK|nr:hypothetical protein [Noviherbaspirillum galbum]NEX60151.1 hypothetical protein [Noviherbaspirillum galbum]